jgi:hypothetical protein
LLKLARGHEPFDEARQHIEHLGLAGSRFDFFGGSGGAVVEPGALPETAL